MGLQVQPVTRLLREQRRLGLAAKLLAPQQPRPKQEPERVVQRLRWLQRRHRRIRRHRRPAGVPVRWCNAWYKAWYSGRHRDGAWGGRLAAVSKKKEEKRSDLHVCRRTARIPSYYRTPPPPYAEYNPAPCYSTTPARVCGLLSVCATSVDNTTNKQITNKQTNKHVWLSLLAFNNYFISDFRVQFSSANANTGLVQTPHS